MFILRASALYCLCGASECPAPLRDGQTEYKVQKNNLKLVDLVRERKINTVVWRPKDASGPFPLVTINHGAGMAVDNFAEGSYAYLGEALAARGYVVAGWNEYTVVGKQLDYILDSAAIRDSMYNASADPSHDFYELLCDKAVAVGHSLGGGGEFVGADTEVMKNCGGQVPCNGGYTGGYQGLAALSGGFKWDEEGTPDPYLTARRLSIPALFVSGTEDCMVKPLVENYPMYTNMTNSPCRIFANVTGADHCQWAGLSRVAHAACVALEKAAFPCRPTLTAAEQQGYALKYVVPFFESVTKSDPDSLSNLLSMLDDDSANSAIIREFSGCVQSSVVA